MDDQWKRMFLSKMVMRSPCVHLNRKRHRNRTVEAGFSNGHHIFGFQKRSQSVFGIRSKPVGKPGMPANRNRIAEFIQPFHSPKMEGIPAYPFFLGLGFFMRMSVDKHRLRNRTAKNPIKGRTSVSNRIILPQFGKSFIQSDTKTDFPQSTVYLPSGKQLCVDRSQYGDHVYSGALAVPSPR